MAKQNIKAFMIEDLPPLYINDTGGAPWAVKFLREISWHCPFKPACVGILRKKYIYFNDKSEEPIKIPKSAATLT